MEVKNNKMLFNSRDCVLLSSALLSNQSSNSTATRVTVQISTTTSFYVMFPLVEI